MQVWRRSSRSVFLSAALSFGAVALFIFVTCACKTFARK
jgi:hypothetical protein